MEGVSLHSYFRQVDIDSPTLEVEPYGGVAIRSWMPLNYFPLFSPTTTFPLSLLSSHMVLAVFSHTSRL